MRRRRLACSACCSCRARVYRTRERDPPWLPFRPCGARPLGGPRNGPRPSGGSGPRCGRTHGGERRGAMDVAVVFWGSHACADSQGAERTPRPRRAHGPPRRRGSPAAGRRSGWPTPSTHCCSSRSSTKRSGRSRSSRTVPFTPPRREERFGASSCPRRRTTCTSSTGRRWKPSRSSRRPAARRRKVPASRSRAERPRAAETGSDCGASGSAAQHRLATVVAAKLRRAPAAVGLSDLLAPTPSSPWSSSNYLALNPKRRTRPTTRRRACSASVARVFPRKSLLG